MVARHQSHPTVDVVRIRVTPFEPNGSHPSTLAGFVSTLIDVTCDTDLLACARNTVLHEVSGDWVVFVDDGVEIQPRWVERLGRDLERASARPLVACSVGSSRHGGLDVAYRRTAIDVLGYFDEPASPTWTTDLEMQLRLVAAGFEVQRGDRCAA
jgi:hypothetical protein